MQTLAFRSTEEDVHVSAYRDINDGQQHAALQAVRVVPMIGGRTRRVLTVGEALVRLVSETIGPIETTNTLNFGVGGAELNVAIGLARQGADVTWCGRVGDDPWGRTITRTLAAEGVAVKAVRDPDRFTAAYVRERRAGSMVRAFYLRAGSAGSALTRSDLDDIDLSEFSAVVLTGITPALSPGAADAWRQIITDSSVAGAAIVLDVNYRSTLWSRAAAREAIADVLPSVSVLLAGDDEAALLLDVPVEQVIAEPVKHAQRLQELLADNGTAVLKLGADGSLQVDADRTVTSGTALRVPVVDTVGAGDAFAAGWLGGWINGSAAADCLHRGHATAAFVVASAGDWEGLPLSADLMLAESLSSQDVRR